MNVPGCLSKFSVRQLVFMIIVCGLHQPSFGDPSWELRLEPTLSSSVPITAAAVVTTRLANDETLRDLHFEHIWVDVSGDGSTSRYEWDRAEALAASQVAGDERTVTMTLPLSGLKAATDYQVNVQVVRGDQVLETIESGELRTNRVPEIFPQMQMTVADPSRMEPGVTLMNLIRWENQKPDADFGAIVAIDSTGAVRWCYVADHLIFVVRQLSNGNLLYGYGNRADGLIEIDLSGRIVRRWDAANRNRQVHDGAIPVAVDSFHHDVIPLDESTFVALSSTMRLVSPYYDPSYNRRRKIPQANVIGDEIVEMSQAGDILRRYSLFELLDVQRIGYGSLDGFWDIRGYEDVPGGTFDWSHSNSVTHDPRDDSLIVSVRHQDAVIKIDRQTGQLKWILGTPRNWKGVHKTKWLRPLSPPKWQYHQHAVELTPSGTLLLFDNGNSRAVPFERQLDANRNRSRVVEFRVDEQAMTVEQVWEYDGGDDPFYSTFLCDVDWLSETGNVLVTNGGEIRDEHGRQTDVTPGIQQWAEIFEVTYGNDSSKVFELIVETQPERPNIGWSIYRSERIANLFSKAVSGL